MYNNRCFNYQTIIAVVSLLVLLCSNNSSNAQTAITIPSSPYHTPAYANYYYEEVLRLALTKTESTYGKTDIQFYPLVMGRERQRALLKSNGGIDVIWSTSNHVRETQLLAIKVNLLRDLSNYKILLIRKEDKEQFATVKSLSDLRKFKAGTGSHWQDTQVLQKNEMPLMTSWDYEPMFKMLAAKRFDYIIRGSQEIWAEVEQHQGLHLAAEDTLLIHYDLPVYFFVSPTNLQLAERIKIGLELAEKDGSFKKLFFSMPAFKKGFDETYNKHRLLLKMASPE